jgi:hypothetical protein
MLDRVSNYNPWKERTMLVLMENKIWKFANSQITTPIDVAELLIHNQKDVKSKRIILDGGKDHLIPHLSGKNSIMEMWEALKSLFQSKNVHRNMVLREKLWDTKMIGSNTMTRYLTQIQ